MSACPTPWKVSHPSKAVAQMVRDKEVAKKDLSPDMQAYRCKCGKWHVGHSKASLGFRIREARRKGLA